MENRFESGFPKIKIMFKKLFVHCLVIGIFVLAVTGQDAKPSDSVKPAIADGKYGKFERNVFDLWKPDSKKPTPLLIYIHGGGFVNGSKEKLSVNMLNLLLKRGFAVMAINYRLLPDAYLPEIYLDCARAIQFARYKAKEWNIDKTKVAAMGSSAGALTALWIGFHDDLADPNNSDPVLRESSRLKAIGVFSAQTTLDPKILKTRVGEAVLKHKFAKGGLFGIKIKDSNDPAVKKLFLDASPTTYLTKDDPPVWAMYSVEDKPLKPDSSTSDAIHHPNFGKVLKEQMDQLGIECKLRHKSDGQNVNADMVDFILKYLK